MSVSLKDIAERLNLSKTTVSWVLSNQGDRKGISSTTQQKIIACANELNYQPNFLARSLNTGMTGTIGLIVPSISDAFYSEIAKEIEFEAEQYDYTLMICSSESEIEREEKMIRMLKMKHVDGIIIAPTKHSKSEICKLIDENYPFVIFDRYFEELDTNYVIIDNQQSSYTLVKHLISKGCRKIALITTNPHLKTLNLRCDGYREALKECDIEVNAELYGVVPLTNYEQNLYSVLDRIFATTPDVDGFFFTTHILAVEACNYFAERGIEINKGACCASIHNTSSFKALAPLMSSARMPVAQIGKSAVRIVLDEIRAQQEAQHDLQQHKSQAQQCILACTLDLK